jgi:hypothetical protein
MKLISEQLDQDYRTYLIGRFQSSVSTRTTVQEIWEDIEKYVVPYRGMFFKDERDEHTIEWFKRQIYDDTAVEAASTLAASINGALTSFVSRWFGLAFRNEELNEDHDVQIWLEQVTEIAYQALEDSDFSLEISETYTDLVGFGTSVLIEEEEEDEGKHEGLDFQSIPIKHAFFDVDAKGKVIYFYRRHLWTPLQIVDKFGKDNVPEDIVEQSESTDTPEKKEVIFIVFPRAGYKTTDVSGQLGPLLRPYGSAYIMVKDSTLLGHEGGYYEMPAFVPKWRKTNDSQWGNSPAMLVMSDIKTLNDLVELTLSQLAKTVDPPSFTTERGLLSDLDLEPSGLTVVRSKEDFWQYQSTAKFEPGELRIEKLQASIRRAFMVDQLELKESPAMSATEANIRYELMQRLLGPTLGRLKSDLFDPLIERTINILHRTGKLPERPALIAELGGEFDIQYVGPLAKAQRSQTALAMQNWAATVVETSTQLANINPEAATQLVATADWDAWADELADILGVPASVMINVKKRQSDIRKRKKAAENQEQQAGAVAEGQVMQEVGAGAKAMDDAGLAPETVQ